MIETSENVSTENRADKLSEMAIALQLDRHLSKLDAKSRRLEKARRRMGAYYLAKALKKIEGRTSPAEFSAFIRDYHAHFSISMQYHEKPMPPVDFYREWAEARREGGIPMDPDKEPLYRVLRYQVYESPKEDWGTWTTTSYTKRQRLLRNRSLSGTD